MDRLTKQQRTNNMKAVKNKDSEIELLLRKNLWQKGYRYRKNYSKIHGKPDIVFVNRKVAIFCDSEFWHGHNWLVKKNEIKSNKTFWMNKIEKNIKRDKEVNELLKKDGWTILRFWGNEIKSELSTCINRIEEVLK